MSAERRDVWRARRLTPLAFTLDSGDGPVEYRIPDHPARVWVLAALSDERADLLLDALDPDQAEELWDAALDPDSGVTPALLVDIGQTMLTAAAGRPWWQVDMLVATLVEEWDKLDGRAVDRGLPDPLSWPLERLCNWVYVRITDGVDTKERQRIDTTLATPPLGAVAGPEATPPGWEDEAASWAAAAASLEAAKQRA